MSNWANRTKEQLQAIPVEAPNNEQLISVGGSLEPIGLFYRFNPAKTPSKVPSSVLAAGQVIQGTYEGSFTDKKYGKTTHKVRTQAGLVGVPGTTLLNKNMDKVAEGATVRITYNGKSAIKSGPYAGREAHSFTVAASRLK